MTTEEYQMWRESNKMKQQGYNSTVSRWNNSAGKVFDSRAFATQMALNNLNKTQAPGESKRQMPGHGRARSTLPVRALIAKNKEQMVERARVLKLMQEE